MPRLGSWLVVALTALLVRADAAPARRPVNVVLVHGILDTGRIFTPMVRALEKQGCHCLAPSLSPNDCRQGVRKLTLDLAREIDVRFGPDEPIFLVGFSLGGIVTRDYVQNVADRRRVRGVFLIATPHHGTWWASLSPSRSGVSQLGSHSAFLRALNVHTAAWQRIPVHSYWTPFDLMVVPARSCLWPVGETTKIPCLLHPWMPGNKEVIADISERIALWSRQ